MIWTYFYCTNIQLGLSTSSVYSPCLVAILHRKDQRSIFTAFVTRQSICNLLTWNDYSLLDYGVLCCRSGVGAPVVGECDGEYSFDSRKSVLQWNLAVIDANNESGSMEFSIAGHPDDFFPVNVNFISKNSYCNLQVIYLLLSDSSCSSFSVSIKTNTFKYSLNDLFWLQDAI